MTDRNIGTGAAGAVVETPTDTPGVPPAAAPPSPRARTRGVHPDRLSEIPRARWQTVLRRTTNRVLLADAIAQFEGLAGARQCALLANPALDDALQALLVAQWMADRRRSTGWIPLAIRSAWRHPVPHTASLLRRLWAVAPATWQRDLLEIPAMPRDVVEAFLAGILGAPREHPDGTLSVASETKVRAALGHPDISEDVVLQCLERAEWRGQVGAEALTSPSMSTRTRRRWLRSLPVPYTWQAWGKPLSEHLLRLAVVQRTWDIRSLARVALLYPSVRRLAAPGEPWPDAVYRLVVRRLGTIPSMGAEEQELPAVLVRLLVMGPAADREVLLMFTRLAANSATPALRFLDDHARAEIAPTMTPEARAGLDRLRGAMTGVLLGHTNAEIRLTALRSLQPDPSVAPTPRRGGAVRSSASHGSR